MIGRQSTFAGQGISPLAACPAFARLGAGLASPTRQVTGDVDAPLLVEGAALPPGLSSLDTSAAPGLFAGVIGRRTEGTAKCKRQGTNGGRQRIRPDHVNSL